MKHVSIEAARRHGSDRAAITADLGLGSCLNLLIYPSSPDCGDIVVL